jgi:transketolase
MQTTSETLDDRSAELRAAIVRCMAAAGRGHLGPALSLVEMLRVLFDHVLRYDPADPGWEGRDRLILSKGHGCLALYVLLAEKGFFPKEELERCCAFDGILGGHPERGKVPGVEASTGSLGHGLSLGIGMALRARMDRAGHRVFVILGDGESNEGSVWEGALCAGKHGLSNLAVLVDYNKMQSYGPTRDVLDLEPLADKWRAFNFAVHEVDGHDVDALRHTLASLPFQEGRPSALICHTVKGKGIRGVEGDPTWHHKSKLSPEQVQELLQGIGRR